MQNIKILVYTCLLVGTFILFSSSGCSKSGRRFANQDTNITEENESEKKKKKELNKVIIEKDDEDDNEENEERKREERKKFTIKYDENNHEYVEIPMYKTKTGVYEVTIRINGQELDFVFDTGASDIAISELEYKLLLKKRRIKESDIKEKVKYKDASGNMSEATKIILRKVELGNKVLNNVEALVVANSRAPLLLGQSALSRFGKLEIDYQNQVIRLF